MIRAVVITVSDRCARGEQEDASGAALRELLRDAGAQVVATEILSDDLEPLAEKLTLYADREDVNLIVTTGGTGLSPRDNTPEATWSIIEKEAPGIVEAMRRETFKQTRLAMLSRAACGVRSGALIINFPGSPNAVRECFAVIKSVLPHAVALLAGNAAHGKADE